MKERKMTEQIIIYLIALIPSCVAVITALSTAIEILKHFKALRNSVNEKVDVKDLQKKLEVVLSENKELQRLLKKDIESRTHIKEK